MPNFIGQDTIVFIRKEGKYFHFPNCRLVKDMMIIIDDKTDPYFGIEYKDLNHKQYKACSCIMGKNNRREND